MKKFLCVALALVMVLGTFAVDAYAYEGYAQFIEEGDPMPSDGPLELNEYNLKLTGYVEGENLVLDASHSVTVTSSSDPFYGVMFGFGSGNTGDTSALVTSVGTYYPKSSDNHISIPNGTTSCTLTYTGEGKLLIYVGVSVVTRHFEYYTHENRYIKDDATVAFACSGNIIEENCNKEETVTLVCPSKVYDGKAAEAEIVDSNGFIRSTTGENRNFSLLDAFMDYYKIEGDNVIYLNDTPPTEIGDYYVTCDVYYYDTDYSRAVDGKDTLKVYFSITDSAGNTGSSTSTTTPKTGDDMSIMLWFGLLGSALVATALTVIFVKKKKYK